MWTVLAQWASFETERLRFRPFVYADAPALYAILSQEETTRFIHPRIESLSLCQTLLVEAFMRQPLGIWALEDKNSQKLLGSIRLEQIQLLTSQAEIGYFLDQEFWGQGLAKEALTSLVDLAFTQLPLKKLVIKTHKENLASQGLAQRVGFQFLREYKGSDRYSHRMRGYRDYYYTRKDYQKRR